MSEHLVPRKGEQFLRAIGARPEFRDEILGDLAEEFAFRARWDGSRAARRWYYRECLRVAPYLVRDWWRDSRGRDRRHIASAVAQATLLTLGVDKLGHFVVAMVLLRAGGWESGIGSLALVMFATISLVNIGVGTFGGYVAARIGRRAPLVSAVALAVTWAGLGAAWNVLLGIRFGATVPIVIQAANIVMVTSGALLGGILRAWRSDDETRGQQIV